jgi:tRNA uridine 5-carboxymethylaminomethyl modification enzyme
MGGVLHVGSESVAGGRMGDTHSSLSRELARLGFDIARFKTGTPCRLRGRTIEFSLCAQQGGDATPQPFSFVPHRLGDDPNELFTLNRWREGLFHVEQQPCWITQTTDRTHAIIRANLDKSPLYTGLIQGTGPRYCPSIEDKVVKFAEKASHQVFLEPEGRHTEEYYVNGASTSLPYEIQYAFIRSIPGLHRAEIIRPGYAVEYDYCPPTQLHPSLETKRISGLFFAGQVNGTSGYEEAAAQGLMAGTNAALKVQGKPPLLLGRDEAYIGVLVDDLVTKGVTEPYRMFTSRAEHRLLLRHDNADLRLTPRAAAIGLVDADRRHAAERKAEAIREARAALSSSGPSGITWEKWLKRPENDRCHLPAALLAAYSQDVWEVVEVDVKYDGYLSRQREMVQRSRKDEECVLPETIDYSEMRGLKKEARQALDRVRPRTLGQASRLQAVTPADMALLSVIVARNQRRAATPSRTT